MREVDVDVRILPGEVLNGAGDGELLGCVVATPTVVRQSSAGCTHEGGGTGEQGPRPKTTVMTCHPHAQRSRQAPIPLKRS